MPVYSGATSGRLGFFFVSEESCREEKDSLDQSQESVHGRCHDAKGYGEEPYDRPENEGEHRNGPTKYEEDRPKDHDEQYFHLVLSS